MRHPVRTRRVACRDICRRSRAAPFCAMARCGGSRRPLCLLSLGGGRRAEFAVSSGWRSCRLARHHRDAQYHRGRMSCDISVCAAWQPSGVGSARHVRLREPDDIGGGADGCRARRGVRLCRGSVPPQASCFGRRGRPDAFDRRLHSIPRMREPTRFNARSACAFRIGSPHPRSSRRGSRHRRDAARTGAITATDGAAWAFAPRPQRRPSAGKRR
ncbi:hypothetical protein X946_3616 [Burkholderia sp. ABCPW 111]|nr:hypothetical protein X946_3616 [Burkholderia sp. ABCPW 111]